MENVEHRGKFLEAEGGHYDNGAKVRISHWHGGHHQYFLFQNQMDTNWDMLHSIFYFNTLNLCTIFRIFKYMHSENR